MRIANDLVPRSLKLFPGLLTINQLFDYIYFDELVRYNSQTWSIQGTLYLYFGFWLSPVAVFGLARFVGRGYAGLENLVKTSPAFAAFFVLLFVNFIEFGTFERVIPDEIVRALTSYFAIILLAGAGSVSIFPQKSPRPTKLS